jgi:hypothetical protein
VIPIFFIPCQKLLTANWCEIIKVKEIRCSTNFISHLLPR